MKHLIELNSVQKYYSCSSGRFHVLRDISLYIERGEFTAITGSSGSAKSTLMNILGCLDAPSGGEYRLCGRNIVNISENERTKLRNRAIGFIFQGFNLIPALSALENVELPLLYRGVPYKERQRMSRTALSMVGLEQRVNHRPYELSGGQQQRVAIARAIAAKPPLILADEPTGSLDSESGKSILCTLKSLNKLGATIVLITHDKDIAKKADRTIKISDGMVT